MASKGQVVTISKTSELPIDVDKLKAAVQEAIAASLVQAAQATRAPPQPEAAEKAATAERIQIYEDDPFLEAVANASPVAADPVRTGEPTNRQDLLQIQIVDPQPDPEIYEPPTQEFRYWDTESALDRAISFWGPLLPSGTQWSTDQQPMQVNLDEGEDFNAFYARDSGLNFFHGLVDKVAPPLTVFSCASPDVSCHECGHAILDAVKPELFNAMSLEVAAFHEFFGDASAMLSKLQLASLRDFVLRQTRGRLSSNSRLSQLARQLGWAIRVQVNPTAVDRDCLRNASNNFFYRNPAGLPPRAPATQLASEPHSFSRVFSGAFLDVLAGMFKIGPASLAGTDSEKLLAVAVDAGRLLIEGVRMASVTPGFYSQVAAGMIQADQSLSGGRYRTALTSSFVQRGILSPTATMSLVRTLREHSASFGVTGRAPNGQQLQFESESDGYKMSGRDAPNLPLRPLATRFGITLHVHMPAEGARFPVAAAALAGETQDISSAEEDARSFVEDLIQRDKISHQGATDVIPVELTSPGEALQHHKTHYLVREDGKTVLKRHHFDCGFCGCNHHH
ncbi:hypothetical protein [Bradyrhizobium sp. STM 3557]|uniref:hypothetical protein n=1 Tax=Bradyrhizobium sp. STM 3557 TaxID=578920 RepID=UPI00388F16DD